MGIENTNLAKRPDELRIACATPTAGMIHHAWAASFTAMVLHFLQTPVLQERYRSKMITQHMQIGSSIHASRDILVDQALESQADYLLFIDDDMGFQPEALNQALRRDVDIVAANYRKKSPQATWISQGKDKDDNVYYIETTEDKNSLEPCTLAGFGFTLIKRAVLEALPKPRFLPEWQDKFECYTTEDYPFFTAARAKGFEAYVDHTLSKMVWHNGSYSYMWDTDKLNQARARDRT